MPASQKESLPTTLDTRIYILLDAALREDLGEGDVTTEATIPRETAARGYFTGKEDGVLAGLAVATAVFEMLDSKVEIQWDRKDGDAIEKGVRFGTIEGPAHSLLIGERLALNLMQRMSGIATATRWMVEAADPYGAKILDTRKTAPGLRLLDKWAVQLGGGVNHRFGLFDMILIKDNHIASAGGIRPAIEAAQRYRRNHVTPLEIEVETRTLEEVEEALAVGGIDRILLDNMVRVEGDIVDTSMLEQAVQAIDGQVATEASGNVTLATVPAIAATGVEFISSGTLTHSVKALDISMKIELNE